MAIKFVQAKHYHPGRVAKIRVIVIHDMEMAETLTTAEACARMFATTTRDASAHYCVDDNSVIQSVKDKDTAWAAPGCNADGLHIEHAGYAKQSRRDWTDAYSRDVLALSAKLTAKLALTYGISPKRLSNSQLKAGKTGIVGHAQVSTVYKLSSHTDPGPDFPWDAYLLMVRTEYNALKGKRITRRALGVLAAGLGLSASVFAGTTAIKNSPTAPSPTATPKPTLTLPKPTPKLTAKPTPAPTKPTVRLLPYPGKLQRHGSRGVAVTAIQKRLKELGAKSLSATGYFGSQTRAATVAFQRKNGLTADGIVGKSTWKKLAPRA